MTNQIGKEWSRNERTGGRITLPAEPHFVDINGITPIINRNWWSFLCAGLGIFGIVKTIEILVTDFNSFWWSGFFFLVLGVVSFILAVMIEHFLIGRKLSKMKEESVRFFYQNSGLRFEPGSMGDTGPFESVSEGDTGPFESGSMGDTEPYGDSGVSS